MPHTLDKSDSDFSIKLPFITVMKDYHVDISFVDDNIY